MSEPSAKLKEDGWHFADDIFKSIFNENFWILNEISLKYVPCLIDKKSALVQVMAWRLVGAKPLPELMLTKMSEAI